MTIKIFFNSIKTLIYLLFFKKIYLINSPQNYISLVEYLSKKNIHDKKVIIFVGFVSKNSFKQILKIHKSNLGIQNRLIFLQKVFGEKKEKLLNLFLRIIKFNKSFCIVGDKKSLLFKLLYQGSKKTVFLDDGLNLLTFTDKDIKINEYELFSYFDLKTEKLVKNNFAYLRKRTLINNIDNDYVWLLGTPAANFEIIENKKYNKIINLFANKFKDKKILFFPHRDEIVDETFFSKNIIVCTLCGCYPRNILGAHPSWYKSFEYRSKAVYEPRQLLEEFGTNVSKKKIVVNDSDQLIRYYVIPEKPKNIKSFSE